VGNGWMIHSASSVAGPVIEWAANGYYRDHYVYGRRLIGVPPKGGNAPLGQLTAGDAG
jgi:hypothetical protein